ncbi:MAG: hypothetical protein U1D30_07515 [Planctomycetota bacterium]
MKPVTPAPETVEGCQQEIAALGLRLERADTDAVAFRLIDPRTDSPTVLETFQSELWTDLDCAQAAVRFARYFLGGADHFTAKDRQ